MGYDKYVKEALAGAAEVYYPEENCRFAEYVLRQFLPLGTPKAAFVI